MIALALCGGAVIASLAGVVLLGKPDAPAMAQPLTGPATPIALHGMAEMVATVPPKTLPALSYVDGAGVRHDLTEFHGRPVLLNLWATWCQPCVAELPALAALARGQGADGIAVVALSTDRGGAEQVRKFLAAHAIDLPIRVDPTGESGEALGARGLPTTLVIDAEGRERGRYEGAADWNSEEARRTILAMTAK